MKKTDVTFREITGFDVADEESASELKTALATIRIHARNREHHLEALRKVKGNIENQLLNPGGPPKPPKGYFSRQVEVRPNMFQTMWVNRETGQAIKVPGMISYKPRGHKQTSGKADATDSKLRAAKRAAFRKGVAEGLASPFEVFGSIQPHRRLEENIWGAPKRPVQVDVESKLETDQLMVGQAIAKSLEKSRR